MNDEKKKENEQQPQSAEGNDGVIVPGKPAQAEGDQGGVIVPGRTEEGEKEG